MNFISVETLKILRKIYNISFQKKTVFRPLCEFDPDNAANLIYDALIGDKPCMISRFGNTELLCLCNYIGIKSQKNMYFNYIKGRTFPWWWEPNIILQMQQWSGFFPARVDMIEQFCELMLEDIPLVDILGSWLEQEDYFKKELKHSKKIHLELLNPYFSQVPWTKALDGKKVLVVHPFAKTIELQYKKRELLFENNLLPKFELKTIKAVQSIAGTKTSFVDWFEALEYMKFEIDKVDYDICLIGAGAYGLPLAAHVKRMGKKGFHLGGSLQLLFGVRGRRWENEKYDSVYNYSKLMNEHWVKPGKNEMPIDAIKVEGACYW